MISASGEWDPIYSHSEFLGSGINFFFFVLVFI